MKLKNLFIPDTLLSGMIIVFIFLSKNETLSKSLSALLLLLASFYFLFVRTVIIYKNAEGANRKLLLISSLIIGYFWSIIVVGLYYYSDVLKIITQGIALVFLGVYYFKFDYSSRIYKNIYWYNLMLLILSFTGILIVFD